MVYYQRNKPKYKAFKLLNFGYIPVFKH